MMVPAGEALALSKEKTNKRSVWSYSLCRLPQEDESARLEESLREQSLSFWEDAEALQRFIALRGLSQSACAALLGRSQASVANRLRVLKLPADTRERMRRHDLTERHARALLRVRDEDARREILNAVIREKMNVARTEACVEEYMSRPAVPSPLPPGVFAPLLVELERLRLTVPGITFALRETEEQIHLLVSIPQKDAK